MTIWGYILWYFIIGEIMLVSAIAETVIVYRHHFGMEVLREGGELFIRTYMLNPHTKIGNFLMWINGHLIWPKRMCDLPWKWNKLWKYCKFIERAKLRNEDKKEES